MTEAFRFGAANANGRTLKMAEKIVPMQDQSMSDIMHDHKLFPRLYSFVFFFFQSCTHQHGQSELNEEKIHFNDLHHH